MLNEFRCFAAILDVNLRKRCLSQWK